MDMKNRLKYLTLFNTIIICFIFVCFVCLLIAFINSKEKTDYYEKNIDKVVEVAAYDKSENKSFGTGWFIECDIIVTNYHVISYLTGKDRSLLEIIEVRFYDEYDYICVDIVYYDSKLDIAFLKYNGNHKHSYFETANSCHTSEDCYSIGNYQNLGLSYKVGYISLDTVIINYNNIFDDFVQVSIR